MDDEQTSMDYTYSRNVPSGRLKENAGAADVHMTDEKVKEIDIELEMMEMSEVFGGSPIKNNYSIVELLKNVNAMAL